jgi:hypothetical protein
MKGSLCRLLVIACVGGGVFAGVALAGNTGSFFDPSGDATTAPDVTGVSISNDDAGVVSVKITLANRTALGSDDGAAVGIDTDQNPDTGSLFYGTEYELDVVGNQIGVLQAKADGDWTPGLTPASLNVTSSGGVVTFSFKASDFGVAAGFNLYVLAFDRNWGDAAPETRTVNYQLVAGTSPPALGPDRRAPIVEAQRSNGVHGRTVQLVYSVLDGRGETAEAVVVYRGKKVVKRIGLRLQDKSPFFYYYAPWRVPKKLRGSFRFCVTSRDAAGNKSRTSCAALSIK